MRDTRVRRRRVEPRLDTARRSRSLASYPRRSQGSLASSRTRLAAKPTAASSEPSTGQRPTPSSSAGMTTQSLPKHGDSRATPGVVRLIVCRRIVCAKRAFTNGSPRGPRRPCSLRSEAPLPACGAWSLSRRVGVPSRSAPNLRQLRRTRRAERVAGESRQAGFGTRSSSSRPGALTTGADPARLMTSHFVVNSKALHMLLPSTTIAIP